MEEKPCDETLGAVRLSRSECVPKDKIKGPEIMRRLPIHRVNSFPCLPDIFVLFVVETNPQWSSEFFMQNNTTPKIHIKQKGRARVFCTGEGRNPQDSRAALVAPVLPIKPSVSSMLSVLPNPQSIKDFTQAEPQRQEEIPLRQVSVTLKFTSASSKRESCIRSFEVSQLNELHLRISLRTWLTTP